MAPDPPIRRHCRLRRAGSDDDGRMTIPTYEQARLEPLLTDAAIERRVDALIGRASRRALWLLFLDDDQVQLPLLIPVDHLPAELPDDGAGQFAMAVHDTARTVGGTWVIFVIEELHGPGITSRDRDWARAIHSACDREGMPVRGILLSHRDGVRWIPRDDYRAL